LRVDLIATHPAQQRLLDSQRRFNVACLGRRFGKTALGVRLLVETALSGRPAAWYAPIYKDLSEVWRETVRTVRAVTKRKSEQEKYIQLITGGSIDFWTLDDPDSGRGRKYQRVIIDEAAKARHLQQAWEQTIRPTLTDYKGGAWFLSTPKGRNFFSKLHGRAAWNPDEWAAWQMPTTDNPYIDPAEVEAARAELPELVFRQEYLAEFLDFAGAVVKRDHLRYATPPPGLTVTMGVDLAISTKTGADYTAAVALGRAQDGTLYVLDAQRVRAPFHQVLAFIQSMADKWRPKSIAIEQVQYQAAVVQELLRTTTLPVRGVTPERDKLTRFQPLLARYEQHLVCHAPGLPGAFDDELLTFPVGKHDDQVDALSYAYAASKIKKRKPSYAGTINRSIT
jgi:predicted phage terminase large subunit-like protein